MAFDKPTRNRLASFVGKARDLIADEFTQQFQSLYGISDKGSITPLDQLGHLADTGLATAALLRERINYLVKTHPDDREGTQAAVTRLAREQAFTVLNRLAAIRMAEKRGIIVESVGKGYQSKGFKVFEQVAGSGLGDTYHRYCRYLYCLFDELAVDLGVLFDRRSPHGVLFPRETTLLALYDLLNATDLDPLWAEDETIGWIYQYYNDAAERKKMREHAAPRNSRELAVRNQFFTPRYVVEFLTDNTLGRIWYEMTKGETRLAVQCRYLVRRATEVFLKSDETISVVPEQEGLSQEELFKQPVYITHRQVKDPRELRMLDPACGSMHFGLYAFDLYEVIYEEAWEMGMESLRGDFPDKETFLCEVPRLIIEHNIHGIDIDPRAAQIAGLSLWLRAQKSWQAQKVPAGKRLRIIRSNIVCAEPMPGEKELLREFTTRLEVPALGYLVEQVFDKMQLAGEAGSLLKIEEEIRDIIAEAKRRWQEVPKLKQMGLFGNALINHVQTELPLDFSGITDERFWEGAEEKVCQALQDYSEVAGEHGYQRRLFAEDAAKGFAFIDICRKAYDVIVMNPPFGLPQVCLKKYLEQAYPLTQFELYASFVERGIYLQKENGLLGAISSRSFITMSKLENWRRSSVSASIEVLLDLGLGVMDDAAVEACAYTLRKFCPSNALIALDLIRVTEKAISCTSKRWVCELDTKDKNLHLVLRSKLIKMPQAKLLYSIDNRTYELLTQHDLFEPNAGIVRTGLTTFDDSRFLRLTWEVSPNNISKETQWQFFSKGGEYAKYYTDVHLLINRFKNGSELAEVNIQLNGQVAQSRQGSDHYYKPGLTFTSRSARGFSVRAMPADCIISHNAPSIYTVGGINLGYVLAWLNSRTIRAFIELQANFGYYIPGSVKSLPWITPDQNLFNDISELGYKLIKLHRYWSVIEEISPIFIPIAPGESLREMIDSVVNEARSCISEICSLQKQVSNFVDEIYEVHSSGLALDVLGVDVDCDVTVDIPGRDEISARMASYLVGCVLGRWDIRFTTGDLEPPELPDPFDSLPVCPPCMLQNANGLPAEPKGVPNDYPLRISWPGILVDDENHPEDIITRVEGALKVIWNDRWEAIEHEICELLDVKTLRDYFRRTSGFFADHLKRYSKSRRQAPIYWPLSTAKGSYTLWIYYHRLTDQTLHTALADFVDPKLKSVRAEISALRESGAHRDRLEELLDLEKELADFHTEIERIIKLPWKPNLNDGVLITASPLWKLFRLPKWQKDLKACWEKLEKGDYDWAHLAYSIWPKRVEDVCKKDRSIAIAHGLEHLCQVEPPKSKGTRGRKKAVQADFDEMEG